MEDRKRVLGQQTDTRALGLQVAGLNIRALDRLPERNLYRLFPPPGPSPP